MLAYRITSSKNARKEAEAVLESGESKVKQRQGHEPERAHEHGKGHHQEKQAEAVVESAPLKNDFLETLIAQREAEQQSAEIESGAAR